MGSNHLEELPLWLGTLCSSLKTLTVESNCITYLHPRLFQQMPALRRIALQSNPVLASDGTLSTALLNGMGINSLRSTASAMTQREVQDEIAGMLDVDGEDMQWSG